MRSWRLQRFASHTTSRRPEIGALHLRVLRQRCTLLPTGSTGMAIQKSFENWGRGGIGYFFDVSY
jgi:hypothetical protein